MPEASTGGQAVDIGVSDVWAESCPNVTPDYSKVGDFYGPNRVMTFVAAQKASAYMGTRSLVQNRESMRVSWYVNRGSFADDRTGRAESDLETNTDDIWTAPDHPGPVMLWTVPRDSRGGIACKAYRIVVQ